MSDFWTQYWQRGHLTSFGEKYSGNYQGALKDVWVPFFKPLNNKDTLLDLCTGNGALVFLARELLGVESGPVVIGIDFATLPEEQFQKAKQLNIDLRSNVSAESLPFDDDSISHVISQYGLEYTDLSRSLSEIGRVLRTDGQFKFVCHYYDSGILRENRNILNCCRSLSAEGNVLDLVIQLVDELNKINLNNPGPMRGSSATEAIRNRLNEGLGMLLHTYGQSLHDTNFPILVQSLFNPQNRHANKQQMINDYVDELNGVVSRLSDLDNAALSQERMGLFEDYCRENNLHINDKAPLVEKDTGNVAFVFSGCKLPGVS